MGPKGKRLLWIALLIFGLPIVLTVATNIAAWRFRPVPVACLPPSAIAVDSGTIYIEQLGAIEMFRRLSTGDYGAPEMVLGYFDPNEYLSGIAASHHVVYATDFNNGSIKVLRIGEPGSRPTVTTIGKLPDLRDIPLYRWPPHLPYKLATDVRGYLYAYFVSGAERREVRVFPPGATRDDPPIAVIGNEQHSICLGTEFAADTEHRLYGIEGDRCGTRRKADSVVRYGPSGYVEGTIEGNKTTLSKAVGIAVDGSGRVYVANRGSGEVSVFTSGSSGNVAPAYTLTLQPSESQFVLAIAVEADGTLYVVSESEPESAKRTFYETGALPNGHIAVFAPNASGRTQAVRRITYSYPCRILRPVRL